MKNLFFSTTAFLLCLSYTTSLGFSQEKTERIFGLQHPFTVAELPEGPLKTKLETLNPEAKEKAMRWLHSISFKEFDAAEHMRVDNNGGVYTVCPNDHGDCAGHNHQTETTQQNAEVASGTTSHAPTTGAAPVSINNPPAYNSKPDAEFHIYLDFNGAVVSGKEWNASYGVTSWDCKVWSLDGDTTTFSDAEQADMKEIWQRMAEDYSIYDINVTTDVRYDPVNNVNLAEKNKVAWCLFTPTIDKNGKACPHNGAGGVAYVGVFGTSQFFNSYQPAWVTPMGASYEAEAGSHEIGHNMGLSHDGTSTKTYYGGHGSDDISWGPLMGTGYDRNVSQWSKGQYYQANQFQDDLAIIAQKTAYRGDDHFDTAANATPLTVTNGTDILVTTPEDDPDNNNPENKGIIHKGTDIDVFSFQTGAGAITLNINPWTQPSGTNGGNLDLSVHLRNSLGVTVASSNPATNTFATISATVPAGTYYLSIDNSAAGNPMVASPTGYTDYGSLGQYFISGTIVEATPMLRVISITPNTGDVGTTVSVQITGTLFADTPTVKLTRDGYPDINGTNVVFVDSENLACDFDLTGAALGEYTLVVTNPDLESAALPGAFTVVLPTVGFYEEFFDASNSLPDGWLTYTTTGADPLWSVVSTTSHTVNNSVNATCPSVVTTKYLESPTIPVPADSVNLKFSFWHDCDLEAGYDGGTLEFSIDGGAWFDVTSSGSGATFESNGYNRIISSYYRSPIAGKYAISGDSNGFIQTVVSIVDPSKYAGKNLKVRWLLAGDNFAVSSGWSIDTVELTGAIYPTPGVTTNDLEVTAADDLEFSGTWGQAITATPTSYTLTNVGTESINWSASKGSTWLTLSATSGTLGAGESVVLTATVNSNYYSLGIGMFADTITIINQSMPDDPIIRGASIQILPIEATVTITKRFHTYDGTPKPVTVTTSPAGLSVEVTYNGSTTPPTNAGTYTVVATVSQKYYVGSSTRSMEIAQAIPTVTTWPTATSIPVGQAVSASTLTGGSASVSGSFSFLSPGTVLAAGTHVVPVTFTPSNANYATVNGTVSLKVYPTSVDMVRTVVSGVNNSTWTVVNLGKTYTSPVIVATPIYSSSTLPPVVTRIRNVTSTSFELKLDRADAQVTPVSMKVAVVAVNEGVYTVAEQGVKMEAVKFNSTVTASGTGSWVAEARTYQNTYTAPVVVGQVMSSNDPKWSTFWSRGATSTSPVSSSSLRVGKHVGLDPAKTRANETIGYIVIESGTGLMDGVRYQAKVGTDIILGFGNSATPYKYSLTGFSTVSTAAVSQTGMDGTEGSWAVLSGAPALTTTNIKLHVAEDAFTNSLRTHTSEQVAYIVFE